MRNSTVLVAFSIALSILSFPLQADRRLEDPSYYEGMLAIRDMHGLNMLGIAGELIGIYNAIYAASDAAIDLHGNKWRPGEDDLAWVDRPKRAWAPDPLGGLRPYDRLRVAKIILKIDYLQGLVDRWSSEEEMDQIREAILIQYTRLDRIAADYREDVLRDLPRGPQCSNSPEVVAVERATIYASGNPRMGYSIAEVCWSSRQAHDAERNGDYVKSTKKPCSRCPSGFQRTDHNGREACVKCPRGTRLRNGCCE